MTAIDILRELVELRRLKAQHYVGYLDDRHEDDGYWKDAEAERQYKERKPKAWAAAEALIDGARTGIGANRADKDDNDEVLYALRMAVEHDVPHQAQALRAWMQRIEQWYKDAERYRWIKEKPRVRGSLEWLEANEIDAWVDSKIAESAGTGRAIDVVDLRANANRYQWLRANAKEIVLHQKHGGLGYDPGYNDESELDQAIDVCLRRS